MTRLIAKTALVLSVLAFVISFSPTSNAAIVTFIADLTGPAESPPNASPGIGFGQVDFDTVTHTMRVRATFSGLLGTVTASHIHSATASPGTGTAGVATQTPTFSGFPSGVTSGTYDNTFDMTLLASYNPAFVTANGNTAASAEAALFSGLSTGRAYLNIHTNLFPAGEIRGFFVTTPEPSSLAMLALGAGAFGFIAYRRRRAVS